MATNKTKVIGESPYALSISPNLTMKELKADISQSFGGENSIMNMSTGVSQFPVTNRYSSLSFLNLFSEHLQRKVTKRDHTEE